MQYFPRPLQRTFITQLYVLFIVPKFSLIAVGLDIDDKCFKDNISQLEKRGGYFGKVNIRTGEKDSFTLGFIYFFNHSPKTTY